MRRLLLAFAAIAVSFGGMSFGIANAADHKANIIVVTHGSDTDAFWGVVRNAVQAAKEDTGAEVQYRNPPTGDLNEMASLIEAAIAQNPDGIVVSIPDPDILGGPIKAAVDAGIPVISMNSGSGVSKELGAIMHVGQPEYDAGKGGGDVGVFDFALQIDVLMRLHGAQCTQAVAELGSALELQVFSGFLHAGRQFVLDPTALAKEERFGFCHQCCVAVLINLAHTGR